MCILSNINKEIHGTVSDIFYSVYYLHEEVLRYVMVVGMGVCVHSLVCFVSSLTYVEAEYLKNG